MVTPKPPFRAPNVGTSKKPDGCAWAAGIGALLFVIYLLSQCSNSSSTNSSAAMNSANAEMSNSIAAQTPPPVEPLSAASVARGASHYRTVFAAESHSGAMVYSQNCYDALSREFSWAKLDQCGGFDMVAVRAMDAAASAPSNEQDYFQSEAAAGRYLAAATGAGEPADDADRRLSQLQARSARERAPRPRPSPANDDETEANLGAAVNGALDQSMDELVGE